MSAIIGDIVAVSVDDESSVLCVESPFYYPNTRDWCTMPHAYQSYWLWERSNGSHKIHFVRRYGQTCTGIKNDGN